MVEWYANLVAPSRRGGSIALRRSHSAKPVKNSVESARGDIRIGDEDRLFSETTTART